MKKVKAYFRFVRYLVLVALGVELATFTVDAAAMAVEAGPTTWAKTYDTSAGEESFAIQETSDGGYVLAGWTGPSLGSDAWVLKMDATGTIQWQKAYSTAPGNWDGASSIQQTTDGGYIVTGWTNAFAYYGEVNNLLVFRLDADGNVQWMKVYGCTFTSSWGNAVRQTSDGGYIVAAGTHCGTGYYKAWILKLDADGNIQWQRAYGGIGYDGAGDIQQTSDGGYVVAGQIGFQYGNEGAQNAWVFKLDADGDMQWQKAYGGLGRDYASSIQQTPDGGYIVGGATQSFGAGDWDAWVLKLDAAGNIQWQKTYGGPASDSGNAVRRTADGGYVVAGHSYSFNHGGGATDSDAWVFKLDATGDIQWQKAYGGLAVDQANAIQPTSDGGYIAVGRTWSFGVGVVSVLKLDRNGNIWGCTSDLWMDTSATPAASSATPEIPAAPLVSISYLNVNSVSITPMDTAATVTTQCEGTPPTHTLTVTKAGTGNGTVTSDDGGINCGSDCSEAYPQGTVVPLTASPDPGSTFAGWSGDADCSDGVVTLDADKTCTAEFIGSWVDITDRLNITYSTRPLYDRIRRVFFIQVAVENLGDAIAGPVRLVITDPSISVKPGVGVGRDPDGYTEAGDPYFIIVPEEGVLGAGERHNLRINFERQRRPLTFGIKVEVEQLPLLH
nr:lipoprotein [uncultured Gammaproteobacteria bacterium]